MITAVSKLEAASLLADRSAHAQLKKAVSDKFGMTEREVSDEHLNAARNWLKHGRGAEMSWDWGAAGGPADKPCLPESANARWRDAGRGRALLSVVGGQ